MTDMSMNGKRAASVNKTVNAKKPNISENNVVKCASEVPMCLKKLVKQIVRTFYGCEHALLMNLLLRNTIMKEDDLIDRLKFDKKMLRQILHSLKTDQFIKSKMQLETEPVEGKSVRITHYFIDFKLFVNVVKYKLDVIQKRLEAEQRESTSRASFKCAQCKTAYTDLEIDRLIDPMIGKLMCTFCRGEVVEEEDSAQRSDACALVARFNQQVRVQIDPLLRECEAIHLASSILEPEIRPLEPIVDPNATPNNPYPGSVYDEAKERQWAQAANSRTAESQSVKIILAGGSHGDSAGQTSKERPVWLRESTVHQPNSTPENGSLKQRPASESVTQTLVPGRVPLAHASETAGSGASGQDGGTAPAHGGGGSGGTQGDGTNIMQLLLVHERRGLATHSRNNHNPSSNSTSKNDGHHSSANKSSSASNNHENTGSKSGASNNNNLNNSKPPNSVGLNGNAHYDVNLYSPPPVVSKVCAGDGSADDNASPRLETHLNGDTKGGSNGQSAASAVRVPPHFAVHLQSGVVDYRDVSAIMLKRMSIIEKDEYILVGKKLYKERVFD